MITQDYATTTQEYQKFEGGTKVKNREKYREQIIKAIKSRETCEFMNDTVICVGTFTLKYKRVVVC